MDPKIPKGVANLSDHTNDKGGNRIDESWKICGIVNHFKLL